MSTVDRGLLPPELRGLRTFKVYQSDGQPLRPAVDSDSRKAYYKALNRLSKTVADLLESMGREDPRHHDTPLPQRSGLAVYVAETTAELEGARAGLCDDAEKSARTRTDIRRMLAASRGTDGSNPVPSSRESANHRFLTAANENVCALISMVARSTARSDQTPDTLMHDRKADRSTKVSCNARPHYTLGQRRRRRQRLSTAGLPSTAEPTVHPPSEPL